MSFSLSPGVITREIDLSAVVGAAVSSFGAFAGKFHWGPANQPTIISGEEAMVQTFGYPDNQNAVDFFTMSSFFAYSSGAWITRIGNSDMKNASYPTGTAVSILNDDQFNSTRGTLSSVSMLAKYPGAVGNTLGVSICSTDAQFKFVFKSAIETVNTTDIAFVFDNGSGKGVKSKEITYTGAEDITELLSAGDYLIVDSAKYLIAEVDQASNKIVLDRLYVGPASPDEVTRMWRYYEEFASAPTSADRFHLVVFDNNGYFKQAGSILELFDNMSVKLDDYDDQNVTAYWENVINNTSNYLRAGEATPLSTQSKTSVTAVLDGGSNAQSTLGLDEYINAYGFYLNDELYDTPLIIGGEAITSNDEVGAVLANYVTHSLAEIRKDALAFISPPLEAVLNNKGKEAISCAKARAMIGSSSYATMDSNWKYMYDKYNDTFRWIPCNGDHAGLYAQNDRERDPWVSAAGTSKGRMKNVVKFAWNPDKPARDILYSNDVNPMFVMAIAGPVLFGDKTLLGKNTALSRNNVRRLLIVLEKTISKAAVDMLFEFNDEFTQRRFVSMVEPFLKDAQGRRGLTAFRVIADESVNTPQVIQNNSFVGQIYIKPNYTISDIRLDFVVVNASASFEEVIGSY